MNTDTEFLMWLRDRLIKVYQESEHFDFVQRLETIAKQLDRKPKQFDVVPTGWKKGQRLTVSRQGRCEKIVWFVEPDRNTLFLGDFPEDDADAIAGMWFYTWNEFADFMQWWYEE